MQTTRVPLMLAAALVLAFGVELLRRQTAREIPARRRPTWVDPSAEAWAGFEDGRLRRTGSQRWSVSAGCASREC